MTTLKGNLAEFQELGRNKSNRPGKCILARRIDALGSQDRADLLLALEDLDVGARTIQRWFGRRDVRIDDGAISKHRRQECCCDR